MADLRDKEADFFRLGLQAEGISKQYQAAGQRLDILKNVDLHLKKGEMVAIVGASGTGKTLVSQAALKSFDLAAVTPVLIFVHPGMGKGPLLDGLLAELGKNGGARRTRDRLSLLHEQALALYQSGRRLVVVIDEAHFLAADGLHILRTLSNLETETEKLITVLLIAEEGLSRRLRKPSYASLRTRITFSVVLQPLSVPDSEQYIKYRILKSGGRLDLIPAAVYADIHRFSKGIPREINRLLYNSLIEALAASEQVLHAETVARAAAKLGLHDG